MPADNITKNGNTDSSTLLQSITLVLALLTFLLALIALIGGVRFHTLQLDDLNATKMQAESEAASIEAMENTLRKVEAELDNEKKERQAAKKSADRYRQQATKASLELENTRTELDRANTTITQLKASLPIETSKPQLSEADIEIESSAR